MEIIKENKTITVTIELNEDEVRRMFVLLKRDVTGPEIICKTSHELYKGFKAIMEQSYGLKQT